MERVLPETDLRQWVLTFPFSWRRRLAQDGALLSTLSRLFVDTVHSFYAKRTAVAGGVPASAAKSGAVTVAQRTSSDLRLNPHLLDRTRCRSLGWMCGIGSEWRGKPASCS